MGSQALQVWQGRRAARLDNLVASHRAISGATPGRKWLTEELNHALILRLAAEFQGYCRNLHDEAIWHLVETTVPSTHPVNAILRSAMQERRQLDRGNATWSNLLEDFARLGSALKEDLRDAYPGRYDGWVLRLDQLNYARNALIHDDATKIDKFHADHGLTLATFKTLRSSVGGLAIALSATLGAYLKSQTGTEPW